MEELYYADDKTSTEIVLASSSQRRLYTIYELNKNDISYNISNIIEIEEKIDEGAVKEIYRNLSNRHEALRTVFKIHDNKLYQEILKENEIKIEVICFKSPKDSIDKLLKDFIKPFDLNKGPLFRVGLVEFKEKTWMIFDIHHIVADGTCLHLLMEEFIAIYKKENLSKVNIQYKDYSKWQEDYVKSEKAKNHEDYWKKEFSEELPILNLPYDYPVNDRNLNTGDKVYLNLDEAMKRKISKLAKENIATPYLVFLAVYNILLSKYTDHEDIIVGSVTHGRTDTRFRRTFGMFVNTLAIRNFPKGDLTFREFLSNVKNKFLDIKKNEEYQFEMILSKINVNRETNRNPLFDTMLVYQNMRKFNTHGGKFKFADYKLNNGISKFDITLFIEEVEEKLCLEVEYNTGLFKKATIERFIGHFITILKKVIEAPDIRIVDISMLTVEEEANITLANDTLILYNKEKLIHILIDETARKFPDLIAIDDSGRRTSYGMLMLEVNKTAKYLIKKGVGRDVIVPVIMERNAEIVIAILGILKAGAAFLPIDNIYPIDRIQYMVKDCNASILITKRGLIKEKDFDCEIIDINECRRDMGEERINLPTALNDLAYVIYTSGSTGKPKGVMIEHDGFLNYISWAGKSYAGNRKKDFPLFTSISFDLTITSIFTPLTLGGTIVIYGEEDKDILVKKVFEENRVDIVKLTPAHLKLVKEIKFNRSRIKTLIVGGENLEVDLCREVHEAFDGDIEIYNEYGPTEAVVGCMIYKYDYYRDKNKSVPIGKPADNIKIYVLDKYKKNAGTNIEGEIYISGRGIARGYLNMNGLTMEKFLPDPYAKGYKMYKTGDFAKRLADGNIEYIGRKDDQIKIRGYRIEIGEIEKALTKIEYIKEAIVLIKKDDNNNKSICAYVISDATVSIMELRNKLSQVLPSYMIPSCFYQLDKLILTSNGKVDKKALLNYSGMLVENNLFEEPSKEVEFKQVKIWKDILGINKLGVSDNFYALGGDSIKAIQISSRLNIEGLQVKPKDILTYQTIKEISLHVAESIPLYSQDNMEGELRLNPIQTWFFNQGFNNPNYFNQSILLEIKKDIRTEDLELIFQTLVKHHDALRLNYDIKRKILYFNNNHLNREFNINEFDISNFNEEQQVKEINYIGKKIKSSLDITKNLLIKAVVINTSIKGRLLLITIHHLVVDGVSWRIILEDIYNIYKLLQAGETIKLPSKTASLKDWYNSLIEFAETKIDHNERTYWEYIVDGEVVVTRDFEIQQHRLINSSVLTDILEADYTQKLLKDANKTFGTEPLELMLAALTMSVGEWKDEERICIELENHGRHMEDINVSRTVGWFTAMYPVLLSVSKDDISCQIKTTKEEFRRIPSKGIGFGIQKQLKEKYNGYFDIRFNYLGQFGDEINNEVFTNSEFFSGSEVDEENHMTCKIDINCMIVKGILEIEVRYIKSLFDKEDIYNLLSKFIMNLRNIIDYSIGQDEVFFTPSDFEEADLDLEDLDKIFG